MKDNGETGVFGRVSEQLKWILDNSEAAPYQDHVVDSMFLLSTLCIDILIHEVSISPTFYEHLLSTIGCSSLTHLHIGFVFFAKEYCQ